MALSKEFEDKDSEALAYYKKVANLFPEADSGEMAAGAVRRLESVGRQVELQGTTIKGKPFRLSSLRGKPVVVHYWARQRFDWTDQSDLIEIAKKVEMPFGIP